MKNALLIGAGALGVMYGEYIQNHAPDTNVYFVADKNRIDRYRQNGFSCNGRECNFKYLEAGNQDQNETPVYADLLFFCVKTFALEAAIEAVRPYVKPDTIVISVMNGISSEEIIREGLGLELVLDGLSMGGNIMREKNHISFLKMGFLNIGIHNETQKEALSRVTKFFDEIMLPYICPENIQKKMWEKFMVNVGNNQAAVVFHATFGQLCNKEEEPYKVAHAAMEEVIAIAKAHGIEITKEDVDSWDKVAENLNPVGKCSMLQDAEAGRQTEVEHFAGEVIRRGESCGIPTPINQMLYEKINR